MCHEIIFALKQSVLKNIFFLFTCEVSFARFKMQLPEIELRKTREIQSKSLSMNLSQILMGLSTTILK